MNFFGRVIKKYREHEKALKQIELITKTEDMKNLKITKERVLEAANSCSDAKSVLKKLFPEVFESDFEVGKWYYDIYENTVCLLSSVCKDGGLNFVKNIFGEDGCWYAGKGRYSHFRPATQEEVEEALIKEAKRRGFKEGVKFKTIYGSMRTVDVIKCDYEDFAVYCKGGGVIYEDGKWAEVVSGKKEDTNDLRSYERLAIESPLTLSQANNIMRMVSPRDYSICFSVARDLSCSGFSFEKIKEVITKLTK